MKTKITGFKELNKYIKSMQKFLKAPEKFFARVALIGQTNVVRHFNRSLGPSGKWAKLKYRKGKPLLDNGDLRKSISKRYSRKGASVGSNLPYAAIHNYGGMAGRGRKAKIPQREFLWIDKKGYEQMEKAMVSILGKL